MKEKIEFILSIIMLDHECRRIYIYIHIYMGEWKSAEN